MLKALDTQHRLINAEIAKEKEHFYCPSCHETVFLKKGTFKQPHFAHYQHSECQAFSEGESEEHLLGKKCLYEWFEKQHIPCQMEAYLPELSQRPDLLIWPPGGKPTAIEFQCSSLSTKRMIERTKGYQMNGYEVFWIMGKKFHLHHKISSFQRLFLKNGEVARNVYLQFNSETTELKILTNLGVYPSSTSIFYDTFTFCLHDKPITLDELKWIVQHGKAKNKEHFSLLKSHDYLNKGRLFQDAKMVQFQKYIYCKGYSLISLPLEVYIPIKNDIYIQSISHYWKFILLDWVISQGIGQVIDRFQFEQKIKQMIIEKKIAFYTLPCLSKDITHQTWKQFVSVLIAQQILLPVSSDAWLIRKKPYLFQSESEKLAIFKKQDERTMTKQHSLNLK
ncbi:competence protein CoiA [Pisciglobus halotolerans]|uniref:Competence protein CoiA n=1 Tax=Pisciglobus halotolerans TaxID=745365 RepID=A0A1I3CA44_9LACT|nr:competence protein CoiA family protein [Pisciglobus halotolerans]SFH70911.1 competence protein CoiA [Pisciglobus halotolerans]